MTRSITSIVILVALGAAACTSDPGGSSPTDPTAPTTTIPATTTTTLPTDEAVQRFESCLAESDLDLDPITLDAQGRLRLDLLLPDLDFTNEESIVALSVCSEYLTTGALDLTANPLLKEKVVGLLAGFSECLRSRGVSDFPDPIEGFSGIGGPFPLAEIPYADPDLAEAVEACRERLTGR
ncbi:MAG: hypothetical protein U9N56_08250 [Actinomycetota bacterium]|nr:hypothetical protein [Actinomycetota bacterium]